MINDNIAYLKAKIENEILLVSILRGCIVDTKEYGEVAFRSVFNVPRSYEYHEDLMSFDENQNAFAKVIDSAYHIDVVGEGYYVRNGIEKHKTFRFDAKDVKDENISTRNYTLGNEYVDFCQSSDDNNWTAFRLTDGIATRLSKFVVVDANEICSKCKKLDNKCCLVSLDDIYSCTNKFEVEADF